MTYVKNVSNFNKTRNVILLENELDYSQDFYNLVFFWRCING